MTDLAVGIIVALICGAATAYIHREKKRGAACIGCSAGNGGCCSCGMAANRESGSCGCCRAETR